MRRCILSAVSFVAGCAASMPIDADELDPIPGPSVEFDPSAKIVPFPNDLLLDPVSGKVSLPQQCLETETARVLRQEGLGALDGFGTFKSPIFVTFTEPIDPTSLEGRVFLFRSASKLRPDNPSLAVPVPLHFITETATRRNPACEAIHVGRLSIVPAVPLDGNATYVVAILDGAKTSDGEPFYPSTTWALVRQSEKPVEVVLTSDGTLRVIKNRTPLDPLDEVDLQRIAGLALLWDLHREALTYLDVALAYRAYGSASPAFPRTELLLAWSFTTQTIQEPLDPSAAVGPASKLSDFSSDVALTGPLHVTPTQITDAFEETLGAGICGTLPCAAVGSIVSGRFDSTSYQIKLPNPAVLPEPVPGPWDDPLDPGMLDNESLVLIGFVPASPPPPEGYPVVVFGHGLGSSKESLYALAPQLAGAGIASVGIDWVAHGSRAVRIAIGPGECAGMPTAIDNPTCFAPILSSDLLTTRDSLRQSVLDGLKLVRVLKTCATNNCNGLPIDPQRIGYVGQSLGGLLGPVLMAVADDIKAAVFNVGGVGWVDVLEQTDTIVMRCPIVDALINAGILPPWSVTWDDGRNADALCLTNAWRRDPGYRAFAMTARWIADPVDGANFVGRLADSGRPVLVQEVVGDSVVPNISTDQLGALLGLQPMPAALAAVGTPFPSAAIGKGSAWITYETVPFNESTGSPGNAFSHGSLLAPATVGPEGALGTAQMQIDVLTFLLVNL